MLRFALFAVIALTPCLWPAAQEKRPQIRNMENLNTAANETDPCPSPDGQQFLYSSDKSGRYELYLASRTAAGQPLVPQRCLDELSTEGDVRTPFLLPKSSDGWEYLYYATPMHTDRNTPNLDIYRVGRFDPKRPFQGNNAASPVQLICTQADEAHPWLSADGKELYFSRKTKQGWQLMRAVGQFPRVFEKAEPVDVPPGFHHACLNKAATRMVLQGPLAAGEPRQAVFLCRRKSSKDAWSAPVALASLGDREGSIGACSPCLSADGRFLYFSSDRPGGKGGFDLYVVSIAEIDELK
jgi:Tol biopolymer transport system component